MPGEELSLAAAQQVLEKLTDPAFNEALSPSQGLVVTPHTFSCLEQEGRWKHENWGYNKPRDFTSPILPDPPDKVAQSPPPDVVTPPSPKKLRRWPLFDLKIDQSPLASQLLMGIGGAVQIPLGGSLLPTLLKLSSIGNVNLARVEVMWWDDALEIWGGYAGLSPGATGFGSVFGHRAHIDVTGCAYGNFLPARYLLVGSGWVNPVGPQYYEFRWGLVVRAGQARPTMLFGSVWDREGHTAELAAGDFYRFEVTNWTSPQSQCTQTA
jgi:hypothetical protein